MKCTEISELLSLYIDNMLDENQVREVEEHLSSCDACRKEYNELNNMLALLSQTEMIPVPDEFSFRLKKALKEEKQKMIDEGLITKQPKKKSQWRIITSIAAIFAVGVISFSIYDNVMGNIPFFNNSKDQAASNVKTEEIDKQIAAMKEADADTYLGGRAEDSASSSDGTVVMKDPSNDQQKMMAKSAETATADDTQVSNSQNKELQTESADLSDAQTYGAAVGSEPNTGSADTPQPESPADAGGFGFKSNMLSAQDDCSRSLTGSGMERNSAAVQFYNKQIEEKLAGFDYQVLETTYAQTGEWQFRIFIFRGKDGNTYNEEIRIIGKDGKIEIICSNDFMGL